MPASVRRVTSKSAPICPRPKGVARTVVPFTMDPMRSALGLVLSIAERMATTLRTPRARRRGGSRGNDRSFEVSPCPRRLDVVHVHPLAGLDRCARAPDHLAVFQDVVARSHFPDGELVAERNRVEHSDGPVLAVQRHFDPRLRFERREARSDVVGVVQHDDLLHGSYPAGLVSRDSVANPAS